MILETEQILRRQMTMSEQYKEAAEQRSNDLALRGKKLARTYSETNLKMNNDA